jgi:N-acetylmuramoyl-L-alanine amidase
MPPPLPAKRHTSSTAPPENRDRSIVGRGVSGYGVQPLVGRRIILLALTSVNLASFGTLSWATTRGAPRSHVDSIVVHAVSGPACVGGHVVYSGAPGDAGRWKRFFDGHPFLGIHYVVDREGKALASTPESREANHARDAKDGTIGIELVHQGDGIEPFGDAQFNGLVKLIEGIRRRYNIPVENIVGHGDIDGRTFLCGGRTVKGRSDPGANFPWERLRSALRGPERNPSAMIASAAALPLPQLVSGPTLATRPLTTIEQLLQRIYK